MDGVTRAKVLARSATLQLGITSMSRMCGSSAILFGCVAVSQFVERIVMWVADVAYFFSRFLMMALIVVLLGIFWMMLVGDD